MPPAALRTPEPRDAPDYPLYAGEPLIRELDPTEWNMERLNRVSNGAGCVYQKVVGRGPLDRTQLEKAVATLAERHPLLGARIVRTGEGLDAPLAYVRGEDAPPVSVVRAADVAAEAVAILEADMNAGPSPCWRTSPFRVGLVLEAGDTDRWALLVAGPHAHCDGISLAWLTHELLQLLDGEDPGPPLELRSIRIDELPPSSAEPALTEEPRLVAPESDIPATPERAAVVRTGLLERLLTADATAGLFDAVKRHGITVHGAIGAAVHLAHAARHAEVTGGSPFGIYRAGSPVSMRPHVEPELSSADLRMAVDVAITHTPVAREGTFWQLAETFGGAVQQQIRTGAILASWNRTERRDRSVGSTGVPLPLISNVGRSAIRTSYGPLTIESTAGSMATHGMFQIDMLFTTFDGRLGASFYWEEPTVGRESMTRFADQVFQLLADPDVHRSDPPLGDLLG